MFKFLALSLLFVSSTVYAKTVSIKAVFEVSGEYQEIDKAKVVADGWVVGLNEYDEATYTFEATLDEKDLPLRKSLGDASLSMEKDGTIQMNISVGDADAGASSTLAWPRKDDKLVSLDSPLHLYLSGGDYASGMWSITSKVSVEVKD